MPHSFNYVRYHQYIMPETLSLAPVMFFLWCLGHLKVLWHPRTLLHQKWTRLASVRRALRWWWREMRDARSTINHLHHQYNVSRIWYTKHTIQTQRRLNRTVPSYNVVNSERFQTSRSQTESEDLPTIFIFVHIIWHDIVITTYWCCLWCRSGTQLA